MATISYNRPVTINPDWGVKNLLEAMKKGDQLKNLTKEDFERHERLTRPLSQEERKALREKLS